MAIKLGTLRRLYDKSIDYNIVSFYQLIISMAYLNWQMAYNDKLSASQCIKYEQELKQIATAAVNMGISKTTIKEKIVTVHSDAYPSNRQIENLVSVLESNQFTYVADYIPENKIKIKSGEEIENDKKRKCVIRKSDADEKEFQKLSAYIEKTYNLFLSEEMRKKIKNMKNLKYSYSIILQSFRWEEKTIDRALLNHRFNSSYDKLAYICGIISNKLPDTLRIIEEKKIQELIFWEDNAKNILDGDSDLEEQIYYQCSDETGGTYKGQNEYVKQQLLDAMERLKAKEKQY